MTQQHDWKLDAFVDGELDLAGQLEMERRLATDDVLRGQVETVRALRDAVREKAERHRLPEGLHERLVAEAQRAALARKRSDVAPERTVPAFMRWLRWPSVLVAFAFGAVFVLGANLLQQRSAQGELMEEAVSSHVRSTLGEHLVDVASADHHTVKPYLSARLGFSPPVGELSLSGSTFLGGRVDYFGGRPVAALVYRQGQHVVNSFVWPGTAPDSEPQTASARGYLVARWSQAGLSHCVISDLNPGEFQQLVAAVRRIDPTP